MDGITSFQAGFAGQGSSRPVADPVTSSAETVAAGEVAASNAAVSNQVSPAAKSNTDSKGARRKRGSFRSLWQHVERVWLQHQQ